MECELFYINWLALVMST